MENKNQERLIKHLVQLTKFNTYERNFDLLNYNMEHNVNNHYLTGSLMSERKIINIYIYN